MFVECIDVHKHFSNHLDVGERAGCFSEFVFLVSCDCCVALPPSDMGLSAVCDSGISWSYSLILNALGSSGGG